MKSRDVTACHCPPDHAAWDSIPPEHEARNTIACDRFVLHCTALAAVHCLCATQPIARPRYGAVWSSSYCRGSRWGIGWRLAQTSSNSLEFARMRGQPVLFGSTVQLLHCASGRCVTPEHTALLVASQFYALYRSLFVVPQFHALYRISLFVVPQVRHAEQAARLARQGGSSSAPE